MTEKTRAKCEYWTALYENDYATLHKAKAEQYSGKDENDYEDYLFQDESGKYLTGEYNIPPEQINLLVQMKIERHLKMIKTIILAGFVISILSVIIAGIIIAP